MKKYVGKPVLALTAAALTLTATSVFAQGLPVTPPVDPIKLPVVVDQPVMKSPPLVEEVSPDGVISLTGELTYTDLEGGFYMVGDWSLMGDAERFARLLGQRVTVTGKEFDGISIRMVKSLVVATIAASEERGKGTAPADEPVVIEGPFTLEGVIAYTDLEGGFYTLDGWGLIGDESLFKAMLGKRVQVRGKQFDGVSIQQVRQIEVESLLLPVAAERTQPERITFGTVQLAPYYQPITVDGVLMLPVRGVVEAAGGQVYWDHKEQAIVVTMPDRMAYFWIGQDEAEMNENHVRYLTRNMIRMAKAPLLDRSRAYLSADALTAVLGLYEKPGSATTLELGAPER